MDQIAGDRNVGDLRSGWSTTPVPAGSRRALHQDAFMQRIANGKAAYRHEAGLIENAVGESGRVDDGFARILAHQTQAAQRGADRYHLGISSLEHEYRIGR